MAADRRPRLDEPDAPHTSGITTALILAHVEDQGGRPAVREVLARIGRPDDGAALRDERTWWSWATKIALFEAAADALDDPDVTYTAGRRALETGVAGPLKTALRALGSPGIVYANIVRANHKFSSASRMVVEEMRGHSARIRYERILPVEPHRLDCLYNQGLLSTVPVLFGLPPARIEHPSCALRGAADCVYEVSWHPQMRASWRAIAGTAIAGTATAAAALVASTLLGVGPEAAIGMGATGGAGLGFWWSRRRRELLRSVGSLQRELDVMGERMHRVHTSLHALSSALDYDEVVNRVTEYAAQALGGYDCVLLLEEDGVLRGRRNRHVADEVVADLERWAATGPDALARAMAIDDLATVPDLAGMPLRRPATASLCAAPLRTHGQRLGLLVSLAPRPFSFLPEETAILELFGEQAAVALSNARLYAAQQEMATRDPLTGLRNHREFHETLSGELARCKRSGARFSVAILDLDGFKAVNDGSGHAAGDELLKQVASALDAGARAGDVVFRVGGDEFAVLLPESDVEEAEAAVGRIADRVSSVDPRVGASWGVATWPQDGPEKDRVLAAADERLYEMKRVRRPTSDSGVKRPLELLVTAVAQLVEALDDSDPETASRAREVAQIAAVVGQRFHGDASR